MSYCHRDKGFNTHQFDVPYHGVRGSSNPKNTRDPEDTENRYDVHSPSNHNTTV